MIRHLRYRTFLQILYEAATIENYVATTVFKEIGDDNTSIANILDDASSIT